MTHPASRPAFLLASGLFSLLAALPTSVQASASAGVYFSHHDWEVACDNTRTCRVAGYQADEDSNTISVLFTRAAGAHQAVTGQVQVGDAEGSTEVRSLNLHINGKDWGAVPLQASSLTGTLQAEQLKALLAVLNRSSSQIEFHSGPQRWRLSDKGASAVLLKADDVQGRVGTAGALSSRKGKKAESSVKPALPLPVVTAVPAAAQPSATALPQAHATTLLKALRESLRQAPPETDCSLLAAGPQPTLNATRLDAQHTLISTDCWSAAYNMGTGFWVVNTSPPFQAVLVTTSGSDFDPSSATISATHKSRGVGDCSSQDQWVWNGQAFVHTLSQTGGLCKAVAAGGAWELPTLRSTVQTFKPAGK